MLKIMTNVGKRFTRVINIHKMCNAFASSFGRYIKWLNEWYTMHKSMFLRKNDRIEKNWNSFAAASSEKQAPLSDQTPSRIPTIVQPPPIN